MEFDHLRPERICRWSDGVTSCTRRIGGVRVNADRDYLSISTENDLCGAYRPSSRTTHTYAACVDGNAVYKVEHSVCNLAQCGTDNNHNVRFKRKSSAVSSRV